MFRLLDTYYFGNSYTIFHVKNMNGNLDGGFVIPLLGITLAQPTHNDP